MHYTRLLLSCYKTLKKRLQFRQYVQSSMLTWHRQVTCLCKFGACDPRHPVYACFGHCGSCWQRHKDKLSRMQSVTHSSHRLCSSATIRASVTGKLRTVKARYHQAPQRFWCALGFARSSIWSLQSRSSRGVSVRAGKADSSKAEPSDTSAKKDKAKDKLDSNSDKADSKADSKAESKAEGKASRYSAWPRIDKNEQSRQDTSATASQGLKPVHLATFFIVLGTGLMFLAVLLWFTADIRFQQACVKVLRRLFKTVALRQVMGILGAMTFVRLGLEPMVKMLRRLFRAPGTWEKSAEFYILREV